MEKKYTAKDIEELKKRDPNELTPKEKRLANLHPNKKGDTGEKHLGGRRKGTLNWSTHFRKLMGDEKFLASIISQTPKQWEGIVEKYPASVIAAGLIASATQSVAKAIAEGKAIDKQTLDMIDRIQRIGYGETKNVNIDTQEEGFFDKVNFNFSVVPDRKMEDES